MRFGSALRRALMAGLLALLAFAPGVSLPGTAKLGLGGPAKAQDVFAIDQFYDALAPMASGSTTRHTAMRGCGFPCRRIGAPSRSGTGSIPTNTAGTGICQSLSPGPYITMADGDSIRPTGGTGCRAIRGRRRGCNGATAPTMWAGHRSNRTPIAAMPMGGRRPMPSSTASVVGVRQAASSRGTGNRAFPLGDVSFALNFAPHVYRPEFRNGYVYNYGMPRDRWSRITRQHIEPRRIYRGNQRAYPYGWNGRNHDRGLYVYAPSVRRGVGPHRAPKKVGKRTSKHKGRNRRNTPRRPQAGLTKATSIHTGRTLARHRTTYGEAARRIPT